MGQRANLFETARKTINIIKSSFANSGTINSFGSAALTHIMTLGANDKISVYTANVSQIHSGTGQNTFTREGYSQFLAEYLG